MYVYVDGTLVASKTDYQAGTLPAFTFSVSNSTFTIQVAVDDTTQPCRSFGSMWLHRLRDGRATLLTPGFSELCFWSGWAPARFFDQTWTITSDSFSTEPAPAESGSYDPDDATGRSQDPVNTLTGNYGYHHTDLLIPGRGPAVRFERSYNSSDTRGGPFGPGWTHSYNARLADPGDGTGARILVGPTGRSDRYMPSATGAITYTAPANVDTTLVQSNGVYTATTKDLTQYVFSAAGRLTAIRDRYRNHADLTYNADGQLTSVSDPAGRGSLSFAYDATSGRLTSVTDWASPARTVQYGYDASNRLRTVTDREGKTTTYTYNGTTSRLTMITDANGHVVVTNHYDSQGRVDRQQDARGLSTGQQTTFTYTVTSGATTTTVTYPTTSAEASWAFVQQDSYDGSGRLVQRVSKPTAIETHTETYAYPNDSSLDSNDLTIAAWIKPTDLSGSKIIVSKHELRSNSISTARSTGVRRWAPIRSRPTPRASGLAVMSTAIRTPTTSSGRSTRWACGRARCPAAR